MDSEHALYIKCSCTIEYQTHIELSHNPWIRNEIIMCVFKNRFIHITRIFPTLYLLRMYTGKYFCPNYSTLLFDYMAEF